MSPFVESLMGQLVKEESELDAMKEAVDIAAEILLVHVIRRNAVMEYVAQYAPEEYAAWRAENPEPPVLESFKPYLVRYERQRKARLRR